MAHNVCNMSCVLPLDCPDKLKKIVIESSNPNETLDNLLKFLGDVTNEFHLVDVILELIQRICSDSAIHSSEIEFAILSFQNIYNVNIFKIDVKCKLLEMIVTVLLTFKNYYQPSQEVTEDVVQFLVNIIENKNESASTCLTTIDCLTEIELNMPETLKSHLDIFVDKLNHEQLSDKSSEITSLIIRNTTNPTSNQFEIVHKLLEMLPSLCPFTMVCVTKNILGLCGFDFQEKLENSLKKLIEMHKTTFDLCILQTITSIQEHLKGISNESAVFLCSTHPALPIGRNLIALDWLAASSFLKNEVIEIKQFYPTEFDGADARLKKLIFLSKVMFHQSIDPISLCLHFEQLVSFAVKSGTSRSFAAVFRTMRNMLASKFPRNAIQIVLLNTVGLGSRHPVCLPHIVDFLKNVGSNQPEQLSEAITLGLIDAFDEMDNILFIMPHMGHLIQFFTESTLYQYEFCQPRMVLRIIRNCLEENKSCDCGVEVLELCQALIRNQDYEIFQPELKTVLSLIETSNAETDVKQRAWMLRSLIAHVNTDSLKDAFDADMDLSLTGKIEKTDYSPIFVKVLSDYKITDAISAETLPVCWSMERKRSFRSFYFPLEICLVENQENNYREFFGLKIDFIMDPKLGRAESLYIPVLEIKQVRKACLQIHPTACSAVTIEARVVMSTTDGRIFLSKLDPIHLKLEHFLSPLSSTITFFELWDRLTNQSDKCYSSALFLPQSEQLFKAIEYGELERFQMTKKKPTELAMVTPNSFLVLVRILLVKNSWNAEILVEDPSVLPVIHSLLIEFST